MKVGGSLLFFSLVCFAATLCIAKDAGCMPGYYISDSGSCEKCPKGTFQPEANAKGCKPCPDGAVSVEQGSTKCTRCRKNEEPAELKNECVCAVGAARSRKGKCNLCKPGSRFAPRGKRGECISCLEGTYQPEAGQSSCLLCPNGSSSIYAATKCVSCPKDQFLMESGKCGTCPAGETKDEYSSNCIKCDSGTFKAKAGLAPCLVCPPNTISEEGATKCEAPKCPEGTKPIGKKKKCGKCPAGTYYDSYDEVCVKCDKNYFMPYESIAEDCFACAGTSYTKKKGAKECIKCPLGQRLLKDGTCGTCPAGFYYDDYENKCMRCGYNEYSTGNMDYCNGCPSRTYALPGSSTCTTCPKGKALLRETKKCGVCPAGFYYGSFNARCFKCYRGSFLSSPGIESDCKTCPDGTKSNKERTACVPKK